MSIISSEVVIALVNWMLNADGVGVEDPQKPYYAIYDYKDGCSVEKYRISEFLQSVDYVVKLQNPNLGDAMSKTDEIQLANQLKEEYEGRASGYSNLEVTINNGIITLDFQWMEQEDSEQQENTFSEDDEFENNDVNGIITSASPEY